MPGKRKRSAGKTILLMLHVLLFLSGLALLLYPKLNAIWIDHMLHRDAEVFLSFVHTDEYIPGEDVTQVIITKPGIQETEEMLPEAYPDLWVQMKAYNEGIFRNGQEGLSDESSYEIPSFILADYGLESEVFAVLSIPKLDLKMPIYLGATWQHMADGAAQMTETSLPIGGKNSNCVIAGHRGWNGAAYFLHIPNLEPGDTVIITNLWETLIYEVVETKIVQPYDVESIHIQPKVSAVIQTKANTLVLDFPKSLAELRVALLQSGIPEPPRDIFLMDNEGDPIRVKVYGEDELGRHLARIFSETDDLAKVNTVVFLATDPRTELREEMSQNILSDKYDSVGDFLTDIQQMLQKISV